MSAPIWSKTGTQINMNPGANGRQRGSRMLDELVWKTETEGFVTSLFASAFNQSWAAMSGNKTFTTDDAGKTIYVNASTQTTATIGAASTFGDGFFVIIVNHSSNVCFLVISGVGTRWLWPGDTAILMVVNSGWSVTMPRVYYAPTGTRQYIDQTNGSDLNDGLTSSTSVASFQKGIRNIEFLMDCQGSAVTCYFMGSSHTEGNASHTFRVRGYHVIFVTANLGYSGFTFNVPAGQVGLTCRDYSAAVMGNIRMVGGTGAIGISASQTGIIDWGQMDWGPFPDGIHIQSTNGGSVGTTTGVGNIVSGSAAYHVQGAARSSVIMTGVGYQIAAGLTFSSYINISSVSSLVYAGVNYTYDGGSAANTIGTKMTISSNATAITNGGSGAIPGNVAVATSTGGVLVS